MSDYERFNFKIFLIGDDHVGKKSIINRFRIMKATETKEKNNFEKFNNKLNFPNQIFSDSNTEILKSAKIIKSNTNKKNTSNNLEDRGFSKDSKFNTTQLKEPTQTQATFYQKKIENLTNFTKAFHINKNYLELNFFNCPPAENLQFSDKVNEDEDAERLHKMKLDRFKKLIKKEVLKIETVDMKNKYIFMFVFDITNAKSLERIRVYYEELNKIYSFDNENNFVKANTYFRILVGNKIDLKIPYEEIDRDLLDSFISQKKVDYYEISSKLNFNFERFFENMFYQQFENAFPAFRTEIFKSRFSQLLNTTRTFSKEPRSFFKINETPGPDFYQNNPYDLNHDKFSKKAFERPERYKNKIFVTKIGPVFNFKKTGFSDISKLKTFDNLHKKKQKEKVDEAVDDDILYGINKIENNFNKTTEGFSIGIKINKDSNYKAKRREQLQQAHTNINNIFGFQNITTYNKPFFKANEETLNNQRSLSEESTREKVRKQKEQKRNLFIQERQKRYSSFQNRKEQNNKSLQSKLLKNEQYSLVSRNNRSSRHKINSLSNDSNGEPLSSYYKDSKRANSAMVKIEQLRRKKKKRTVQKNNHINPGPGNYDTRGKFDLKKGFTFGSRYNNLEANPMDFPPSDKIIIKSDFDEISSKPRFAFQNSARFRELKTYNESYPEEIYKKLDEMTMKKFEKIRENILMLHNLNSKRIEKEPEDNPGPASYNPTYNLIEDKAYSYTMRARTGKDMFSKNEDENERPGFDNINSQKNEPVVTPLADYNVVKESYPAYSFPLDKRF